MSVFDGRSLRYSTLYIESTNVSGATLETGDAVIWHFESDANAGVDGVQFATTAASDKLAGVVVSDSADTHSVQLAQMGICMVKVDTSNGAISSGDYLVTKGGSVGTCVKWTAGMDTFYVAMALESYSGAGTTLLQSIMMLKLAGTASTPSSGDTTQVDRFILSATNITSESIELSLLPTDPDAVRVYIQGAPIQSPLMDYYVDGKFIKWDTMALSGVLQENDRITVVYN